MEFRPLGNTGLQVSVLCLGTMTFGSQCDQNTSFGILNKAADAGINFIDTADVYPIPPDESTWGATEAIIGDWLKHKRHEFIVASKCRQKVGKNINDEGLSRRHIFHAVESSLRRLKTDYLDLFYAHAPDPKTPLEETLRAFDDLVAQGKTRFVGCSNFPAWKVALALGISSLHDWNRFAVVQPRYNLLYRDMEQELVPLCVDQKLGIVSYNPLAGGMLTGKYHTKSDLNAGGRFTLGKTGDLYRDRYWHEAHIQEAHNLYSYFKARGKSLATASVAWVLKQPGITSAILGASKPEQLDDSLSSVKTPLNAEEMEVCNKAWFALPRPEKPPL